MKEEATKTYFYKERVANRLKTKNWHIAKAEEIDSGSRYNDVLHNNKINYDLMNGILNQPDFEYVTKPYGITPRAYLPEDMQNFPILTQSIKRIEGELIKRPDNKKVFARNPEAISESQKKKSELYIQFIVGEIKKARIEEEMAKNPDMAEEELAKLEQEIMTPDEVDKYMRKFKDSYETMGQEILNYLYEDQDLRHKFRKQFMHGVCSGMEIYHSAIENGEPVLRVINPLRFDCDLDPDLDFIHNAEWAMTSDYMTPSRIVSLYHDDLNEKQVQRIYDSYNKGGSRRQIEEKWEIESPVDNFTFDSGWDIGDDFTTTSKHNYIEVRHYVWRSWYKIGFLTYLDENDQEVIIQVPETYKFNEDSGDIKLDWEWFPEIREINRIDEDIWVGEGKVEDIPFDPENPYFCPLPYTGIVHNNLNSNSTSIIDLMKPYQYFYNIVHRMIQRDLASDKGRKLIANINQVPSSLGIDLEKWQHFLENDDIIWVNPNEEGNRGNTDLTSWRSVDMTAAQSINQKVELLEYIERKCQEVIGLNDARMGTQQGSQPLVGTTQQQILQSNYTTEPWFATHELGKKKALEMLLNVAKLAYKKYPKEKLAYVLSDYSKQIINLEPEKLSMANYGIYVSSSSEDMRIYNDLKQLAHAAVQNQSATLSSIAKLIRAEATPGELVEVIEKGEEKMMRNAQQQQENEMVIQQQIAEYEKEVELLKMELEKYKIDKDSATKIEVARINSFNFQKDQDINDNIIPDQLELEKFRGDMSVKERELLNKSRELSNKLSIEREKNRLKEKEIESREKIEKIRAKTALKNKVSGEK